MIYCHVILPRRERVGRSSSGAVALVVKELFERSSLGKNTKIWAGPQKEDQHLLPVSIIPTSRFSFFSQNRAYAKRISHYIADGPNTYIEIHIRANVLLILKKRLKKSHFSLYIHNDPNEMSGLETPAKRQRILVLVDVVICVSKYIRGCFLDGVSQLHDKCIVIHNALDMSMYPPPSPAQNKIIFVGRMIREKGPLELARALVDVLPKYKEWKAFFIGGKSPIESNSSNTYEKKIIAILKPIEKQIVWSGNLPNNSVQDIFKNAKIAVVPSIWNDPHPRVVIEAMANGCAMITSGRGGISETIGDCGLIVNPEKPSEITSALETLINDPSFLETKRHQGYERALKLFDVTDKIKKLDDLRKNIIQNINIQRQ